VVKWLYAEKKSYQKVTRILIVKKWCI